MSVKSNIDTLGKIDRRPGLLEFIAMHTAVGAYALQTAVKRLSQSH